MDQHDIDKLRITLGERLRTARTAKGWDLEVLAIASTVPRDKLAAHEAGRDTLLADELAEAGAALDMPLWFLFAVN